MPDMKASKESPKPFWRENFGTLATSAGVLFTGVAALFTIDSAKNQPPLAEILVVADVQKQRTIRDTSSGQITVPFGVPLDLSADRSSDGDGDIQKLTYQWRVMKVPCTRRENICIAEAEAIDASWPWTPPQVGVFAVGLTVTDEMECWRLQKWLFSSACNKSNSKVFF